MHSLKSRFYPLAALSLLACSNTPEFNARIVGPETIGPCDDLLVDAVLPQTLGDERFVWTIEPTTVALGELLERTNKPRLQIPARLLTAGSQYTITVNVTINNAPAGPGTITVTRQALETLIVALDGPSQIDINGTQNLIITGTATLPRCEQVSVAYEWVQTAGPAAPILEQYKKRNIIQFSPGDLTPGQDYAFELRATANSNPPLSGTAVQNISVERLPPVALIAGGNRDVGACQTIAIDARLSSSPDRRPLSFTWECASVMGMTTDDCGIELPDDPVLAIGPGVLPAGIHRLTVNVSDGERQTAASIDVNVSCDVTTPPTTTLSLANGARLDPTQAVIIEASVADTSACGADVTWEISGGPVDTSLLSIGGSVFAVPANALVANATYSVKARAQNCSGFTDRTTTFSMNAPPVQSGALTASPSVGNAYETVFELNAPPFTDSDGAVMYQYFYIDEAHGNALVALGGPQSAPLLRTTLPAGFVGDALQLRLVATDALGAETSALALPSVQVRNPDRIAVFSGLTGKFRTLLTAHQTAIETTNVMLARGLYGSAPRTVVSNTTGDRALAAVYLNVSGSASLRSGLAFSGGCTVIAEPNTDYYGVFELDAGEMLSLDPASSMTGFVEVALIAKPAVSALVFDLPISSERAFFHNTGAASTHSFDMQYVGATGTVSLQSDCVSAVGCGSPFATLGANQSVSGPMGNVGTNNFIVATPAAASGSLRFSNLDECATYLYAPLP